MQKIVVAFDSLHFSESALKYGIYLARQNKANLVGAFLDNPSYYSFFTELDTFSEDDDNVVTEKKIRRLEKKDIDTKANGLKKFETACREAGIRYAIHRDDFSSNDLIRETIFADLLIIGAHEKFTTSTRQGPSSFLRNLLKHAHCPVLLVPDSFSPIDSITVLYNGDPSSVLTLKMFSYLFPDFDELQTEIICAAPHFLNEIPESHMMKEWVQRHFASIDYKILINSSEEQLLEELKNKHPHSLIIAGAYRRNMLSMLLHPSLADRIIEQLNNPLFVAHY